MYRFVHVYETSQLKINWHTACGTRQYYVTKWITDLFLPISAVQEERGPRKNKGSKLLSPSSSSKSTANGSRVSLSIPYCPMQCKDSFSPLSASSLIRPSIAATFPALDILPSAFTPVGSKTPTFDSSNDSSAFTKVLPKKDYPVLDLSTRKSIFVPDFIGTGHWWFPFKVLRLARRPWPYEAQLDTRSVGRSDLVEFLRIEALG
jgi:hypothetical protein